MPKAHVVLPVFTRRSARFLLAPALAGAVTLGGQATPAQAAVPAAAPVPAAVLPAAPVTALVTHGPVQAAAAARLRPGTSAFGARVLAAARPHAGKRYRWGATGPSNFDCSGLTQYVYKRAGVRLPRNSRAQRAATRRISRPVVGDLVFVHNGGGGRVSHVGIYAGNGRWFEASSPRRPIGLHKAWSKNISYGRVR